MYWEVEMKLPQDIIFMEYDWPKKELDLANHQLISVVNPCATFILSPPLPSKY